MTPASASAPIIAASSICTEWVGVPDDRSGAANWLAAWGDSGWGESA